ncbi:hypothetical protein H4R33_000794 [Dimargaris cristalligena]|uniref:UspA domain-containing protein n=1 Tax=Dimargaris cristalligena TaxID=215637 RepID=A0A4V1J4H7_9FUNG|nr:hypothetical protein H4R33_000794 [Dimargaris cristalligena]RKP35599.1 hypothetical protein BJ085DRAFT_27147 [Dimargaris cristalligena]|eukprot:RKP35599.1 hypothetical protein BJ085DRAFT_27147 [Dimargaris cristalligena]
MSSTTPRTIVIAINPKADETKHTLQWAIDNFLNPDRDSVQLVAALCLESDLDAISLGINAGDLAGYLVGLEEENEGEITNLISQYAALLSAAHINHESVILKGHTDVRDIVVNYINDLKAHTLIVGSRDLGVWKRLWLGSFSDFCVHSVHCPVIVVKSPDAEEQ